jgi:hypothetical protein
MLQSLILGAIFFAIMAGWRLIVTHVVYDYGAVYGFMLAAGLVGLGFWMERRWPEHFGSTYPESIRSRLEATHDVMIAGMAFCLGALLLGCYVLPKDWHLYLVAACGFFYVRWVLMCHRREKRIWREDDGGPDHQSSNEDSDRLPVDSFRHGRLR